MKVLILGAGSVGRQLAHLTKSLPLIKKITIADRYKERALQTAHPIQAEGIELNVLNQVQLRRSMEKVDLVISTVGPCSRFGKIILETAVLARRCYIDVSDDPLPTLEMLTLNQVAQTAGILAIIGMGASPGITNMLAVEAGVRLDHVDRIVTGWGSQGHEDEDMSEARTDSAALDHWVDQVSGKIPVWQNYQCVQEPPLKKKKIYYPGSGFTNAYTVGHPEAITLVRRFPELRESLNVMDFSSYVISCLKAVGAAVDCGALSPADGSKKLGHLLSGEPKDLRNILSYTWHGLKDSLRIHENWLPPFFAVAEGSKDGKNKIVGACLAGTLEGCMAKQTAIPTAIAIDMMSRREIPGKGVKPPETALNSDMFFQKLLPFLNESTRTPLSSATRITIESL
tara:strand:- start:12179 stop:13372 length:1194 start_codon:yes stop_codon:yes gene_type:complete